MEVLYPFLVPILSFLLQSYPRLFNKYFGVDVWTRLLEARHMRKAGHKIPQKKLSGQFIIEGYFDYPPIFPFLLSYFSKETILKLQGFIASFFDSLQVVLVYFTALYLTNNQQLALLAQVIYMLTPMIAIENSNLTPRSLGYLNLSLAVLPLLLFEFTGNWTFYMTGVIFTTFLFLTHRFAMQSFLFISIFFTFYLNTPVFIQAFLLGFALAVFATRGYYLRVLKGHLLNIYFWVLNLDYRWAHQVRGLQKRGKQAKTDWVAKIYDFMSVFSPVALFGTNPWALSGFIIVIASLLGILQVTPLLFTLGVWILFFYFFGVLVLETKRLMPIGEGYRYMEMATVPSSILSAFIFFELFSTPYGMLAKIGLGTLLLFNLAVIIFFQIKGVIKDRNRSITDDLFNVFAFINKMKKKPRIICVPHQNTTMTVFHTKAQVFVNADNPGLLKIQEVYPILRKPLADLAKKYNLTHALVKESFATLKELKLAKKNVVFKSGDVKLVAF